MRFVDLFAGLGGFHLALRKLGHTCVFASEIDSMLRELYERNFGIKPYGDIRDVQSQDIPAHDILCAGFPCQPFSKAGGQSGFSDPEYGGLFHQILRILDYHKPAFVILENVPNFQRHDRGRTWEIASSLLSERGYEIQVKKLSPHDFGIPQIRERVYIVGSRSGLRHFSWPIGSDVKDLSIRTILEVNPGDARKLSESVMKCIAVWQDFLDRYPKGKELPSFPIWSAEFGATYPYSRTTPFMIGTEGLKRYRGSHGRSLRNLSKATERSLLPSYALTKESRFPDWKINFIRQNRQLYEDNRDWIDRWKESILEFPPSSQKLEWNCKGGERDLSRYILQFRASGLRVKRPTNSPSLVAMTSTQVPIISWEQRYMTPRECARLQSMGELENLPESPNRAYKALGNAINVEVARLIASALLSGCESLSGDEPARRIAD